MIKRVALLVSMTREKSQTSIKYYKKLYVRLGRMIVLAYQKLSTVHLLPTSDSAKKGQLYGLGTQITISNTFTNHRINKPSFQIISSLDSSQETAVECLSRNDDINKTDPFQHLINNNGNRELQKVAPDEFLELKENNKQSSESNTAAFMTSGESSG